MPDRPRVAVVGYLSLDTIDCQAGCFDNVPGGAALYAALGANAAGADVVLIARAGMDFPAEVLRALAALGIDVSAVEEVSAASRRARLPACRSPQPYPAQALWWERTEQLAPPLVAMAADAYVFGPMPAACLARQLEACRKLGGLLVADTSTAFAASQGAQLLELIPQLDLFAPSREETRLLYPDLGDDGAAARLAETGPCVAHKRGADGFYLCSKASHALYYPSRAERVVDTTGAGDASVGALAAGLAAGLTGEALLAPAARAAARALAGVGPAAFGIR